MAHDKTAANRIPTEQGASQPINVMIAGFINFGYNDLW